MDDRANAERADDAAIHNALSGKARSVAQAQNVYGGVHMYNTSPSRTQQLSTPSWITCFLAIFAIVVSLTSLLLALRRITFPVLAGLDAPTSGLPGKSRPAPENFPDVAEMEIPAARDDGRHDYLLEVPEIAHMHSFQAYECAGRMYHQVTIGVLEVLKKKASNIESVAAMYGDNIAKLSWRSESYSKYESLQPASRTPFGGSIYRGVQLFGVMPLAADAKCDVDVVMIGVLALDCGDSYCLFVVLVGASCHSSDSQRRAAHDVRFILDHIVIR